MAYLLLFNIIIFAFRSVSSDGILPKNLLFRPNYFIGKYELNIKNIFSCNPTTDNKIQHNIYLNKKSDKSLEIKGNLTLKIPLDDTFFLEINMAMKDSSNGWKENIFTHKVPKGCSSFKLLMGNEWTTFLNGFGLPTNTSCPVPVGLYIVSGFDISNFMKTSFPKEFMYGTYKFRYFYSRKNEIFGCNVYIIELKRP